MKPPSECPTAESFPVVQASVCERGGLAPPGIFGSEVPVRVRSGTCLHRSRGWHSCLPDPLPLPLGWTSLVTRLLAGYPADKPYRREV